MGHSSVCRHCSVRGAVGAEFRLSWCGWKAELDLEAATDRGYFMYRINIFRDVEEEWSLDSINNGADLRYGGERALWQ